MTLLPQTTELPHTTLYALLSVLPHSTELPHTTDSPVTLMPDRALLPQTTELPHTTDVFQMLAESGMMYTEFVAGSHIATGDFALPLVAGAKSALERARAISR